MEIKEDEFGGGGGGPLAPMIGMRNACKILVGKPEDFPSGDGRIILK
jgi:hypothetical protein